MSSLGTRAMGSLSGGIPVKGAKLPSGHTIPLLGFGTFGIPPEKAYDATSRALDTGFRHIDSAVCYGNEAPIGQACQAQIKAGKLKREDLFITTKIWNNQKSKEKVQDAVKESLKAFGFDYLDLVLIHWPITDQPGDTLVPSPQETWEGLEEAVDKGLVRSIGVSNHSPEKISAWYKDTRIPVSVNQVEIHPVWRQDRIVDWCRDNNIHVTAYSPLTTPGQMASMGKKVPNLTNEEPVVSIASKLGKTPAQVLLAWGMQRGTSVIPKAFDQGHQEDIAGSIGWELPAEDFQRLSQYSPQIRFFEGKGMAFSEEGPWHTYEEFWDEPPPQ